MCVCVCLCVCVCVSRNVTGTFTKSKTFLTEKSANGATITHTTVRARTTWFSISGLLIHRLTMGKFDRGVRYVIIFQYVQFWIRLAAVSYRGKKVRTVVSSAVRSVNKSRDTRNCVQNKPEYAICGLFATHLYYKAIETISCALIWQIRHKYNRLQDDHCAATGHRKMSALGTAGAMVTTHEIFVVMWSFKGPTLSSVL